MSEEPRRIPRTLSCLVKGPLGCLTFLVGAGIVLVLFFPPAGGRLLRTFSEEWFAQAYHGTLEVGDAWVGSLYGPQRIESLVLRDPDDDEVLRGSVQAPSLEHFDDGQRIYGPIVLQVASLRLAAASGGTTNLGRALAPRQAPQPSGSRRGGFTTDGPMEFPLEARIERLRFEGPAGDGGLEGVVLTGSLVWGPYQRRLRLAGGIPADGATAGPEIELDFAQAAPEAPWRRELVLRDAPRGLASLLCPALAPLAAFAGPTVDLVHVTEEQDRFSARVEDEGARFDASGARVGGALEAASVTVRVPCGGPRADAILRLLPFLRSLECEADDGTHVLRLAEARWPLGAGEERASGELHLELAAARGLLREELVPAGASAARVFLGGEDRRVRLADGVLELAGLRLPAEGGGWISVDGTVAPARGALELTVEGVIGGEPLPPRVLRAGDGALPPLPIAPGEPHAPEAPVPDLPAVPERAPGG